MAQGGQFLPRTLLLVFLLVLTLAGGAFAQDTDTETGTITGTVTSTSGAPLSDVRMLLTDRGTGKTTAVRTNAAGSFVSGNLPATDYTVRAELRAFVSASAVVIVKPGVASTIDLKLAPEPVLGAVSAKEIDELPLRSRNFLEFLQFEPGVQSQNAGTLAAFAAFVAMFVLYTANHPAGLNANVAQTAANKGVILALVAMAQTFVVLTSGIDLSVGMVMVLANCMASYVVVGGIAGATLGVAAVLAAGAACGAINGLIVIFGRLQPIVTTIATGAVYYGIALALRPVPGGDVESTLADAVTGRIAGVVPSSIVLLAAVVAIVWWPFRRSVVGRAVYAVGSAEVAAYMSGVPIRRAKLVAYTLSGLLASVAGLFVTFVTYSGEASAAGGSTYTLYSIAAVVLGGVSLFGGSGSAIGAIFGALMFRTIGDLLFVFNVEPLWQPLFQGLVLLGAVCLGSWRLLRIRNRLELYG